MKLSEWYTSVSDVLSSTIMNAIITLLDHVKHAIQILDGRSVVVLLIILNVLNHNLESILFKSRVYCFYSASTLSRFGHFGEIS